MKLIRGNIYKFLVIGIVVLSVVCFFLFENKQEFVASAFGAFVGVGLSIGVDRWLEEYKNNKLRKMYLINSLNLINTITEVIHTAEKGDPTGQIDGRAAHLLSGIPHQSFEDFLSTGLQIDLPQELQDKFLDIRKRIISLHAFLADMNSGPRKAGSNAFHTRLLELLMEFENQLSARDDSLKKLIEKIVLK